MKKTMKILTVLLLAIVLITFTTNVLAADSGALDPKNISATYSTDNSGLTTKAGKIMGMIMVLGVKYMLGSVEEKAEYKKSFVPLIIGIVLVVAATAIASFIFTMAE